MECRGFGESAIPATRQDNMTNNPRMHNLRGPGWPVLRKMTWQSVRQPDQPDDREQPEQNTVVASRAEDQEHEVQYSPGS